MFFMNRRLVKQELIDLNELSPEETAAVFAILKPLQGAGDTALYLESEADAAIEEVRRRPQDSYPLSSDAEEDHNVIDFNGTMEPFERIADGIERLINLLVPKEREPASEGKDKEFYDPTEAAELLGVRPQSIMKWCRQGKLQGHKIGGGRDWRIRRDAIERHLRRHQLINGQKGRGGA